MSLKYALIPNLLTSDTGDYMAQVKEVETINFEEIIQKMIDKRTSISETDMRAVVGLLHEVVKDSLLSGYSIDDGIVKIDPSIEGVFKGEDDTVDGKTKRVKINANVTKEMRELASQIKTEKIDAKEILPHIIRVEDYTTGDIDHTITSGKMIKITGSMLKVEGDNADIGVYFIGNDGAEHKVSIIGENKPSNLMVMVPTLATGDYTLEVRTQYTGGRNL